jgi:innexin
LIYLLVVHYISDCLQRYEEYIHPSTIQISSAIQRYYRRCHQFCQARTGASLVCFYFFIKCLYIVNIALQIVFLQYFLSYHDVDYLQYGFNVFTSLLSGLSLPESRLFPRITLCDFQIRELGERHHYTVECILVINIFIEKMYFILWLWFWLLLIITIVDTIRFIYQVMPIHSRNRFIVHHLDLIVRNHESKEAQFRYFLHYFPVDNLLALWIIASNSNSIIVAEILDQLFYRKLHDGSDV